MDFNANPERPLTPLFSETLLASLSTLTAPMAHPLGTPSQMPKLTRLRPSAIPVAIISALFSFSSLAFSQAAPPANPPARPYLVIDDTTSPDGRYAVVWKLPKGPKIDWEKFRTGESSRDYLPNFDSPASDVEITDELIELSSGRKLATVASGYWALPKGESKGEPPARSKDQFLEVSWSDQSDFVITLHRVYSQRGSLKAFQLKAGAVTAQLEFGRELESAVRARLRKLFPRQYERAKADISVTYSDVKALGASKFSLTAHSALPKRSRENKLPEDAVVTAELRPGPKGKPTLHVLGFKKVEDDAEEAN